MSYQPDDLSDRLPRRDGVLGKLRELEPLGAVKWAALTASAFFALATIDQAVRMIAEVIARLGWLVDVAPAVLRLLLGG